MPEPKSQTPDGAQNGPQSGPESDPNAIKDRLLDAALVHVPFDGWSEATLRAAATDTGVDQALARALFPRAGVDLAMAYHRRGDAILAARLAAEELGHLRIRDRIATAIRYRIEAIEDREAVRRGATLFALPQHAADGARAVWGTADRIWTAMGDTSNDLNWYTKRTLLAGVYGSSVLFWLGDDSAGHQATWNFVDRRIEDVMRFEKLKASVNRSPLLRPLMIGPNWLARQVRAPKRTPPADLPGVWNGQPQEQ
ncbi:COQ9 family protein [Halodurantibacterium flavum]|uniref:COQ9 family protein n=1 Tax=Halodurantibacterium flavum TaxID=1382802 RepID=A0ABW4S1H7_9RHOB